MTASHPSTKEIIPLITGRIVEVGRSADGRFSEAILDIGHGQRITVSGFSDTVARAFAANLYKAATLEVSVHDE